jgi:hypothetical protein
MSLIQKLITTYGEDTLLTHFQNKYIIWMNDVHAKPNPPTYPIPILVGGRRTTSYTLPGTTKSSVTTTTTFNLKREQVPINFIMYSLAHNKIPNCTYIAHKNNNILDMSISNLEPVTLSFPDTVSITNNKKNSEDVMAMQLYEYCSVTMGMSDLAIREIINKLSTLLGKSPVDEIFSNLDKEYAPIKVNNPNFANIGQQVSKYIYKMKHGFQVRVFTNGKTYRSSTIPELKKAEEYRDRLVELI